MSIDRWFVVAVVASMVVLGCVVMAVRNARLNRRDDERDMLLLPAQDLDLPRVGYTDSDRLEDRLVSGPQTVLADPPGVGEPREDQLDEEWADELHQMNAEQLTAPPMSSNKRVMQEGWFDAWEADQAAWAQAWRDAGDDTDMWLAHGMAGVEGEWPPYTMAAQIHTERMVTA